MDERKNSVRYSQIRQYHSFSSRTRRVPLHVSHLDEAVGGLLNVVVAVAEDVEEKVLFDRWEDALQIPVEGKPRF